MDRSQGGRKIFLIFTPALFARSYNAVFIELAQEVISDISDNSDTVFSGRVLQSNLPDTLKKSVKCPDNAEEIPRL